MRIEGGDLLSRLNAAITAIEAVTDDGTTRKTALVAVETLADSTAHAGLPGEIADEINWALECLRPNLDLSAAKYHLEQALALAKQRVLRETADPEDDGVVRKR